MLDGLVKLFKEKVLARFGEAPKTPMDELADKFLCLYNESLESGSGLDGVNVDLAREASHELRDYIDEHLNEHVREGDYAYAARACAHSMMASPNRDERESLDIVGMANFAKLIVDCINTYGDVDPKAEALEPNS